MTDQTTGFGVPPRCRPHSICSHTELASPYIVFASCPRISLILLTEREDDLVEYNV